MGGIEVGRAGVCVVGVGAFEVVVVVAPGWTVERCSGLMAMGGSGSAWGGGCGSVGSAVMDACVDRLLACGGRREVGCGRTSGALPSRISTSPFAKESPFSAIVAIVEDFLRCAISLTVDDIEVARRTCRRAKESWRWEADFTSLTHFLFFSLLVSHTLAFAYMLASAVF